MNYLLIENEKLVGVCDYEPNVGDDDIQVIAYSGNIPICISIFIWLLFKIKKYLFPCFEY